MRGFRLTQASLTSLATEVAPMVEKVIGSSFRAFPTVRPSAPDELRSILMEELHPHTLVIHGIPDDDLARSVTEHSVEMVSDMLLAKYRGRTNLILAQPEAFERIAYVFGEPELQEPDFVRLVLAHECVHALDEQDHQASQRCMKPATKDHSQVWEALMEGHAQFVTARVAEELGHLELFDTYESLIAKAPPGLSETERYRHEWMHRYRNLSYVKGRAFFEYHAPTYPSFRKQVFDSIPATRRMILNPGTYPAGGTTIPSKELGPLWGELRVDEEGWRSAVCEFDNFDLRALLEPYLSNIDEYLFTDLRHAEILIFNDGVNPFAEELVCSIWEGPSPQWASKALTLFLDLSKRKDALWKRGEGKILTSKYFQEQTIGFDEAWRVLKDHSVGGLSVPLEYIFARIGTFLLWVTLHDTPVEEETLKEGLEGIREYLATGS